MGDEGSGYWAPGLLKSEYTESDAVTERIDKSYFITFYTGDLLKLTL